MLPTKAAPIPPVKQQKAPVACQLMTVRLVLSFFMQRTYEEWDKDEVSGL
jgi:hypothetical protein